jgi:hypothetical protein
MTIRLTNRRSLSAGRWHRRASWLLHCASFICSFHRCRQPTIPRLRPAPRVQPRVRLSTAIVDDVNCGRRIMTNVLQPASILTPEKGRGMNVPGYGKPGVISRQGPTAWDGASEPSRHQHESNGQARFGAASCVADGRLRGRQGPVSQQFPCCWPCQACVGMNLSVGKRKMLR